MARSPLFRKSIRLLQTAHLQLAAPKTQFHSPENSTGSAADACDFLP